MISETEARKIRGHDLRTSQSLDAGYHGRVALEIDAGAEPRKLLHMHEAVLEDSLAYRRGPLRHAHQRDELRLEIGGEPWEGLGVDGDRAKAAAVPRNSEARRRLFDLDAARAQEGERALQEIGAGVLQDNLAAGHGRGHGVGARLDAVWQHGMLGAMQTFNALNLQGRAADAARSWRPSS